MSGAERRPIPAPFLERVECDWVTLRGLGGGAAISSLCLWCKASAKGEPIPCPVKTLGDKEIVP